MFSILAMGLVLLVTVSLAVTFIYMLSKYFGNLPPGSGRMQKEINKLKIQYCYLVRRSGTLG
jgi:hypothetical protein